MPNRVTFDATDGSATKLEFEQFDDHMKVCIYVLGAPVRYISVPTSELATRLSLLPGWDAKWVKPIVIPDYLGAVVERMEPSGTSEFARRFVRYAHNEASSLPWVCSNDGTKRSNDDIAAVLANGGYERQPEFPRNG